MVLMGAVMGFTAQTLGFTVPRHWAVPVNAVISLVFGGVLMLVATSIMGTFIAFLSLLAVAFSAWVGVVGADMLRREVYDARSLHDTTRTSAYSYPGGFSPPRSPPERSDSARGRCSPPPTGSPDRWRRATPSASTASAGWRRS